VSGDGLHYSRYRVGDHDEWMMRIGSGPALLFLPPLFEEMNRTRALLAGTMRALASQGFECWLPDLPGTGESERALEDVSWQDWKGAAASAFETAAAVASVSLRGGALLDAPAPARWRFAPATGASLARDLARAGLMTEGGGGYAPSEALLAPLAEAEPAGGGKLRIVRLATDRAEADMKLEGPPLWRRAEPQNSPELTEAMTSDISQWVRSCGAC
jgi:alpha-beta hydrolase superfamily lysophospholipase